MALVACPHAEWPMDKGEGGDLFFNRWVASIAENGNFTNIVYGETKRLIFTPWALLGFRLVALQTLPIDRSWGMLTLFSFKIVVMTGKADLGLNFSPRIEIWRCDGKSVACLAPCFVSEGVKWDVGEILGDKAVHITWNEEDIGAVDCLSTITEFDGGFFCIGEVKTNVEAILVFDCGHL